MNRRLPVLRSERALVDPEPFGHKEARADLPPPAEWIRRG
jgi:hypothetical protein